MKQIVLVFSSLLILVVSGCNYFSEPKISEKEAQSIVLKAHTSHIGNAEIKSISHQGNEYMVKWENEENCENGTDYVNDQNGEITKGETAIC